MAVVLNNRVIMASDTQSSYGDIKVAIRDDGTAKLYCVGKMLMATAGNVTAIQIAESVIKGYSNKRLDKKLIINRIIPEITIRLKNEAIIKDGSDRVEFPNILLAEGKKLYNIGRNYCLRILKSTTIGSGGDFVDAYNHELRMSKDPLKLMNEAILYCAKHSRSVDGTVVHYADTKNLRLEVINNDCSI